MIDGLLHDVDRAWMPMSAGRLTLRVIGSTALFLQTNYRRGTKDSDVLETAELSADVQRRLIALAGKGTSMHRRHGLYIEVVGRAFPFLAAEPVWRPVVGLSSNLLHFDVEVLDALDVVVAKLARPHGTDRDDISAMVDRGLVAHDALICRFRSAVERIWHDARADDLPRYVRALHWVERDLLDESETHIELPPWVADE